MGLGPWITHIMFKRLFGSGGAPAETAPELDLEALRDSETVILFKHSPTCGVSLAARSRVEQFRAAHPDWSDLDSRMAVVRRFSRGSC